MKKTSMLLLALCMLATSLQAQGVSATAPLNGRTFAPSFGQSFTNLSTGIRMHYVEQGPADGTPVILLHGFPDSWYSWHQVMPLLPASWHVYAPSLRGHGQTDKPKKGYSPDEMAADVLAFMNRMNIRQAVLVGHSMGSMITQAFVSRYPERVSSLVLIGAFTHLFGKPEIEALNRDIQALGKEVSDEMIVGFQKGTLYKPIHDTFFAQLVSQSRLTESWVWKGVFDALMKVDYRPALKGLPVPALLIWGDHDPFALGEERRELAALLPNSRVKIHPDLGHDTFWEDPAAVARDLVEFIGQ